MNNSPPNEIGALLDDLDEAMHRRKATIHAETLRIALKALAETPLKITPATDKAFTPILEASSAVRTDSTTWSGADLVHAYRDACRDILQLAEYSAGRGLRPIPRALHNTLKDIPRALLVSMGQLVPFALQAMCNAATDKPFAEQSARFIQYVTNVALVPVLLKAAEQYASYDTEEFVCVLQRKGWLLECMKGIAVLFQQFRLMAHVCAPESNPVVVLQEMEICATYDRLMVTLGALAESVGINVVSFNKLGG